MCHPAYYPPYEKTCGHPIGAVCACTKYRSEPYGVSQPMGHQPEDPEARVVHRPHQLDGEGSLASESRVGGLDAVDMGQVGTPPDGYAGDAERYGPFESDSILIFQ